MMNMKKIVNILGLISFFALIICVMTVSASASEAAQSEEDWDVVETFDDAAAAKNNFDFYFLSESSARRADKLEYSWTVKDGVITRTGNVDTMGDTVNIAVMTYIAEEYRNFELSVDFKMGSLTNYWPVVAVRQETPGKYHLLSGTGFFMNVDGKINAWGPITDGRVETDIPNKDAYGARDWHTMKIHALDNTMTVYIDGVEVTEMTVGETAYTKGYISLISVNNDCSFDNLKIKSLDVEQVYVKENEPNKSRYAGLGQDLDDIIENGYEGAKIPEAKEVKAVEPAAESRAVAASVEPAVEKVEIKTAEPEVVVAETRTVELKMLVKTSDERKRIFA